MDELELHIERTAARWAYRYSCAFLFLWCLRELFRGWETGLSTNKTLDLMNPPLLLLITGGRS